MDLVGSEMLCLPDPEPELECIVNPDPKWDPHKMCRLDRSFVHPKGPNTGLKGKPISQSPPPQKIKLFPLSYVPFYTSTTVFVFIFVFFPLLQRFSLIFSVIFHRFPVFLI